MQEFLPDLYQHFQTQSFHTSMYASSWFLTLFATVVPLSVACRVMDLFISEVSHCIINDPAHEIMLLITEVTIEGSGEPALSHSLARAFAVRTHEA